jgi:hypothetical protein
MSRLVYLSNTNVSEEIGIDIKLTCDCKTLKLSLQFLLEDTRVPIKIIRLFIIKCQRNSKGQSSMDLSQKQATLEVIHRMKTYKKNPQHRKLNRWATRNHRKTGDIWTQVRTHFIQTTHSNYGYESVLYVRRLCSCISICVYWCFPFLMRSVRLSIHDGSVWYISFVWYYM